MQCLILAGGLGTRMQEYDSAVPKTLLTVAGRPFADLQLRWLASEGVDSVVYSIGHKGDLIRDYVGDGAAWGVPVTFVEERHQLLGTGGAVRLAVDEGAVGDHFFVLYGDSYLRVGLGAVEDEFRRRSLPALMTVFRNESRWDVSNVEFDGSMVVRYRKGVDPTPAMTHIDYGLLALNRQTVLDGIPPGRPYDLALLLGRLSEDGVLGGFEAQERFFEIGSPGGLADLESFLADGTRNP